jgi:signal transduction histidine kinase/PleD family two-component response regulator
MNTSALPAVKILVVDDHPNTAATLARALSVLGPRVDISSATSGPQALQSVNNSAIDILITDMVMPEMTGLELIERLQSHPAGRPTFSFLVTAYEVPGLKVSARRLKVKDVILKPVHPERICQIISKAIEEMDHARPVVETPQSQPFTILIADDQPDNLRLLSRYLEREGYNYIEAMDGLETLEQVRNHLPDLVLLDINMPFKDGFAVLEEIRADPATEHIPVIILTAARLDPREIQAGLNMGADDYVTKPFDKNELFARIRTKLRVKQAEDAIRRRNRELNLLPEIGKELSARLNLEELSDLVLRRTVETLGAMVGHIILLNAASPFHKEYHIHTSDLPGSEMKLPPLNHLVEQIKLTRESILIKDTSNNPHWQSPTGEPARSVVIAPMFGRSALIGLLVLVHEQADYFNIEHQLLLQAIASQAAIAVENARLYSNLAQQQQKLSAILQSAADAIMMFDPDGCVSMLNPAAEKLFPGEEVKLGLPLARGRGYDALITVLDEIYLAREGMIKEVPWPDRRIFTGLFTPITEGACVVILHDVTRFKELEKVKDEFVATASHDLRNPITTIRGYSQLIKQAGPMNEFQLDFIQRIHNAAIHMSELVDNMLDLTKMDLGVELKRESIDMACMLVQLADEFKPQASAKEQTLTLQQANLSFIVEGDALKLGQALRNLLSNAIKYTPNGGSITVVLEHASDRMNIKIKDTGYGIPASDLPHIFNRFYRVRNNGHDEIQGNGLGLAIVKSIAQQHGGDVTVESSPSEGTCFTFALPLKDET